MSSFPSKCRWGDVYKIRGAGGRGHQRSKRHSLTSTPAHQRHTIIMGKRKRERKEREEKKKAEDAKLIAAAVAAAAGTSAVATSPSHAVANTSAAAAAATTTATHPMLKANERTESKTADIIEKTLGELEKRLDKQRDTQRITALLHERLTLQKLVNDGDITQDDADQIIAAKAGPKRTASEAKLLDTFNPYDLPKGATCDVGTQPAMNELVECKVR